MQGGTTSLIIHQSSSVSLSRSASSITEKVLKAALESHRLTRLEMAIARTGVFVDDYLEYANTLPAELQRLLNTIRELDERSQSSTYSFTIVFIVLSPFPSLAFP
ncbi:hypothetical protein Dimus_001786 [Dionaea muscipula]